MNPVTGHLIVGDVFEKGYQSIPESHRTDALRSLGDKKEVYVELTQIKKNRLARLCEQWRKAGFSENRLKKHKREWLKQNS